MPNLQKVHEDRRERDASIKRMLGEEFARTEVRCNHGLKTPEEVQARVCQPSFEANSDDERTVAFEGLLGSL